MTVANKSYNSYSYTFGTKNILIEIFFFQTWPKISNQYKIMKKSKAPEVPKPRETVTLSEDRIDQFRETFAGEM